MSLQDDANPFLTEDSRTKLKEWLLHPQKNIELWGEGAIASLVPWLLWLRKHDPSTRPDQQLFSLTKAVVTRNQHNNKYPLASPYLSYEEIIRHNMRTIMHGEAYDSDQEISTGSSYTAEPLMHLLVRFNLKQTCKALWPDYTKLSHRVCLPDHKWEYCTLKIKDGIDQTKIYPSTYNWTDLKYDAIQSLGTIIPHELVKRPWLLALWWQIAPYRYTSDSSFIFAKCVTPGWNSS